MKKFVLIISGIFLLIGGIFSYTLSTQQIYEEYTKLWEFRRMNPDFIPQVETTRLIMAGHDTTYADTIWIELVQYIGDNIFNGKYIEFVNPFVDKITLLHPHFTKPYNLALISTPFLDEDKPEYEKKKTIAREAFRLGERAIADNCDPSKLEKIKNTEIGRNLWQDVSLENPCSDDMLAYNAAYVAGLIGEYKKSQFFYKIATAQKGGPQASRFLAILTDARTGDHRIAAERFLLTAIEGYDEEPYICHAEGLEILGELKNLPLERITTTLRTREAKLSPPKDTSNPLANSATNCFQSMERAMKQLYLAHITEITKDSPEITTSMELIEKGILQSVPSIQKQDGWKLVKKDGIWKYSEY